MDKSPAHQGQACQAVSTSHEDNGGSSQSSSGAVYICNLLKLSVLNSLEPVLKVATDLAYITSFDLQ